MESVAVKRSLVFLFIFLFQFAVSQSFEKYYLKNIGSISISNTLELRSGNFSRIIDPYKKAVEKKFAIQISDDRIVFQQKGLNEFSKSGFSDYVRVIIETEYGSAGDYEKAKSTVTLTPVELSQISSQMKAQVNSSFSGTALKLLKWNGVSMQRINGNLALKISYIRQLNNNPPVVVNMYQFHNYDRMYTLTTSFRQSNAAHWLPVMNKVVNSFVISNIR